MSDKPLKQCYNRRTNKWHILEQDDDHPAGWKFIRVQQDRHPSAKDVTRKDIAIEMLNLDEQQDEVDHVIEAPNLEEEKTKKKNKPNGWF